MSTNTRLTATAFAITFLIAGCGHQVTTDDDSFRDALAYSQCMRSNGVPDYPDPQQNGNGVSVDVPKGTDTAALTKAEEACRDQMPQGAAEDADGDGVDAGKLADWTRCMRAKLPDFPDPEVSGNTITITLKGTGTKGDSAEFEDARKACESYSPGGSMRTVDGQ